MYILASNKTFLIFQDIKNVEEPTNNINTLTFKIAVDPNPTTQNVKTINRSIIISVFIIK